jgi:hypothetical protein
VRDLAGNLSKPAEPVLVRVRYIELAEDVITVRRGGLLRFRVVTDALPFSWSLGDASSAIVDREESRNAVAYRLPKGLRPGRYRLEVSVNGRIDEGVVVVTRATR